MTQNAGTSSSTPETKTDIDSIPDLLSTDTRAQTTQAATDTTIKAHGSCLCRAITFTLTGAPSNTVLCHCANCAHASGVGFMANSFYHASQLVLSTPSSSETSPLKTFVDDKTDSGAVLQRQFCGRCGSPLFTRNEKFAEFVVVTSGSLEGRAGKSGGPGWNCIARGGEGGLEISVRRTGLRRCFEGD